MCMVYLKLRREALFMYQGIWLLPEDQLIGLQEESISLTASICYLTISFKPVLPRIDSLTLLASFDDIFLHPVCPSQVPEILGIFFNLSTLRMGSISLRLFSSLVANFFLSNDSFQAFIVKANKPLADDPAYKTKGRYRGNTVFPGTLPGRKPLGWQCAPFRTESLIISC